MKLCWCGQGLRLDRRQWAGRTDADEPDRGQPGPGRQGTNCPVRSPRLWQLFQELKSAAGYARSSRTTTADGNRFAGFSGGGLAAKLTVTGRCFRLSLHEEQPPGRSVELCDDGAGVLWIRISDPAAQVTLRMDQEAGGRFRVTEAGAGFAAEAGSFLAFYRDHLDYVGRRMVPLIRQTGVEAPLGHYSPTVKQAVLARLRALCLPGLRAEGERLIRQLNDNSYDRRQQATRALSDRFARYGGLIQLALTDGSQPPEARERLRKIAREHPRQTWVEELITALGLTEDRAYLAELLNGAGAADAALIAERLGRTAGRRPGRDGQARRADAPPSSLP